MTIVLDSSALITLARIGRLALLHQIADVIHVPNAVFEEVVLKGAGRPGSAEVAAAQWILRRDVRDVAAVERLRTRVGRGEAEAIVLAKELAADVLVIDDAVARRLAETDGRPVVGLPGLLTHAKDRGLLATIKPLLDEMLAQDSFWMTRVTIHCFARRASSNG